MIHARESINPKTGERHVRIYTLDPHPIGEPELPFAEVVFSSDMPPYITTRRAVMLSVIGANIQIATLAAAVEIAVHGVSKSPPRYPYEDFIEFAEYVEL